MSMKAVSRPLEKQVFTYQHQIEYFLANLQKGDLGMAQLIEYGWVLYGQTRAGKTSTGHILSGNPLVGKKINGEAVVDVKISRNKKAKIGNGANSETEIPNFFEVQVKTGKYQKTKTFVIDTPGYGDTYGVLRIVTNGFFHYRLYSKVKNMKFLLCFDRAHLSNTAEKFVDTIVQFTSYFKDYLQNKEQIWKSCAFVFTKVQSSENMKQDLKQKLLSINLNLRTQLDKGKQTALKEFIQYIIDEDRYFIIKKVKEGEMTQSQQLLERIDAKVSDWWSRQVVDTEKQLVDMQKVQFSLSKILILSTMASQKSRQQFKELFSYYNQRINQLFQAADALTGDTKNYSLSSVFSELVKDAMGSPQSHQFLKIMSNYNSLYQKKFDCLYNEQRLKKQKQLFGFQSAESNLSVNQSQKSRSFKDKNYIVKKFNTLLQIQVKKAQINEMEFKQRSLQWLQKCQNMLYEIIKRFNNVAYKRNNSVGIIYKYGYLVHRVIEEAKMFVLLIQASASKQNVRKIHQAAGEIIQIFRPLKDLMGVAYSFNGQCQLKTSDLKSKFVKNYDPNDKAYSKLIINQSLIDLFSSVDSEQPDIVQKIIVLVLNYSNQMLQEKQDEKQLTQSQNQSIAVRLTATRYNCISLYHMSERPEQKESNLMLIRKITSNLGKVLQSLRKYELARKVYDSIKFVESVCRIYKNQIILVSKHQDKKQESFNLRIQYSRYMAEHFRLDQAIMVLQETFELADSIRDLTLAKDQLCDLRLKSKEISSVTEYQQDLFNELYFVDFNPEIEEQLKFF